MHDQIISGFCITLINLSHIAYMRRAEKQRWTSCCHYSSSMPSGGPRVIIEGPSTTEILKPSVSRSKRHPTDPLSSPHYTQTQVAQTQAPTRGSETRQRSVPSGLPNGPRWQPQRRCDPRLDPQSRTVTLLGKVLHQTLTTPSL
jgi:hypothetical protein